MAIESMTNAARLQPGGVQLRLRRFMGLHLRPLAIPLLLGRLRCGEGSCVHELIFCFVGCAQPEMVSPPCSSHANQTSEKVLNSNPKTQRQLSC